MRMSYTLKNVHDGDEQRFIFDRDEPSGDIDYYWDDCHAVISRQSARELWPKLILDGMRVSFVVRLI